MKIKPKKNANIGERLFVGATSDTGIYLIEDIKRNMYKALREDLRNIMDNIFVDGIPFMKVTGNDKKNENSIVIIDNKDGENFSKAFFW